MNKMRSEPTAFIKYNIGFYKAGAVPDDTCGIISYSQSIGSKHTHFLNKAIYQWYCLFSAVYI